MIQHQKIWLPDGETHLVDWMTKSGEIVDGKGSYQISKLRKALEYCTNFRTAVDVGAHVGLWTMQLAKQFDIVNGFEPIKAHWECLIRNLAGKEVFLHNVALGNKDQYVAIHTAPSSSGDSWVNGLGDIPMTTLDSFALPEVDFIKIDVEGYETFVLQGAKDTIMRCRPCIIVEQKRDMCEKYGLAQKSAVAYLQGLGAILRAEISGDYILSFP